MSRFVSKVTTMLAIRGVLAILFGIVALAWPGITLMALVTLFGAFALVDSIGALVAAITDAASPLPRGVLALDGVAGIAAGVVTFFFPAITSLALLYIIAAWALITGSLLIGAAAVGPRFAPAWLMLLDGAISVVFGIALIASPGSGILAIVWALGLYGIASGVGLLVGSFGLRQEASELKASPIGRLVTGRPA
jgi:uncharacterized membrane protein HdeD (DUF308 family)